MVRQCNMRGTRVSEHQGKGGGWDETRQEDEQEEGEEGRKGMFFRALTAAFRAQREDGNSDINQRT